MSVHLSRRRLVTGTASLGGAALLAACGINQSPASVAVPSPHIMIVSPTPAHTTAPSVVHPTSQPTNVATIALSCQPYLQALSATGVTISWVLANANDSWLRIGPVGAAMRRIDASHGKRVDVAVTDLQPNTHYAYEVGSGDATITPQTIFRSSPGSDATDFSFVALGDSGAGTATQQQLAAQILIAQPDLALHVGDYVYGKDGTFDNRYFQVYTQLLATTAVFPAIGDNDVQDNGGKPFDKAFVLPPNAPPTGNTRAYAFDYGPAHFIALDTESAYDPQSPQTQWLTTDLAHTRQPWKFVYFHRPAYSAGVDRSNLDIRQAWSPLFERYGVAAVFSGHDHNYQRTRPIRDYSSGPGGVVYIITGGGGATLRTTAPSGATVAAAAVNHIVSVKVHGHSATLQAIGADGQVFDAATIGQGAAS